MPGEIEVTDSIPPVDDLNIAFGDVIVGQSRIEHVIITNTNANHELCVTEICLLGQFGGFYDDFESGNLAPIRFALPLSSYCFFIISTGK